MRAVSRRRPRSLSAKSRTSLTSIEDVSRAIVVLRGRKVLLDVELAALYGVTTKRLNEQVKRNAERFPEDFMFRLSRTETDALNGSQLATGSQKHRDPRFPPYAFTEHGAIMAATTLNSRRAVEMSLYVVWAFVRLREPPTEHLRGTSMSSTGATSGTSASRRARPERR